MLWVDKEKAQETVGNTIMDRISETRPFFRVASKVSGSVVIASELLDPYVSDSVKSTMVTKNMKSVRNMNSVAMIRPKKSNLEIIRLEMIIKR